LPNLRKDIESAVKNLHECQKGKKLRKKYGELPEKMIERPIGHHFLIPLSPSNWLVVDPK
jgi:hypothetical protein